MNELVSVLLDRLKEDDGDGQGNEIEEGEEELFESQKSVQVDSRPTTDIGPCCTLFYANPTHIVYDCDWRAEHSPANLQSRANTFQCRGH